MINRLERPELRDKSKLHGNDSARLAAKAADIKHFNTLVNDVKRSNERVVASRNDEIDVTVDSVIHSNPILFHEVGIPFSERYRPDQQPLNPEGNGYVKSADSARISIDCTDQCQQTGIVAQNQIGKVISVIERIIINHQENKQPRHWQIHIDIGHSETFDITLDYLGKDDWELGIEQDSDNYRQSDRDELRYSELALHLQEKLKDKKLNLSISSGSGMR